MCPALGTHREHGVRANGKRSHPDSEKTDGNSSVKTVRVTLRERKGSYWQMTYEHPKTGERIVRSTGRRRREEALKVAERFEAKMQRRLELSRTDPFRHVRWFGGFLALIGLLNFPFPVLTRFLLAQGVGMPGIGSHVLLCLIYLAIGAFVWYACRKPTGN